MPRGSGVLTVMGDDDPDTWGDAPGTSCSGVTTFIVRSSKKVSRGVRSAEMCAFDMHTAPGVGYHSPACVDDARCPGSRAGERTGPGRPWVPPRLTGAPGGWETDSVQGAGARARDPARIDRCN